jgi:hypothetical protein
LGRAASARLAAGALLLSTTLGATRKSATIDLLRFTDLQWNAPGSVIDVDAEYRSDGEAVGRSGPE